MFKNSLSLHLEYLSAKVAAPSGPPKAAAAAPKGGAATVIKEAVQAPPTDSPLEMKPEDVTPFPCVLPEEVVVEILTSRYVPKQFNSGRYRILSCPTASMKQLSPNGGIWLIVKHNPYGHNPYGRSS